MKGGARRDTVVLLALHKGAAHLAEQLASIAAQDGGPPAVIVSDDTPPGAEDGGRAIAESEAARRAIAGQPPLTVIEGPRQGSNANFRALLRAVPDRAARASFSDQDDIWRPDKTARAIAALDGVPGPAVHCGATTLVDPAGRAIGPSRPRPRPPAFANALVQSLAGGNTMTLNRAAIDLLRGAEADLTAAGADFAVHDWWTYQMVMGAGGRMLFDPEPLLLYRQHPGNQIGENRSARGLWQRTRRLAGGTMRDWNRANVAALRAAAHRLTPEARATLEGFAALPGLPPWRRPAAMRALGLHRQEGWGTHALRAAAVMGRI